MADGATALRDALRDLADLVGDEHLPLDDPQFRQGLALAAHLMRHSVGVAHGANDAGLLRLVVSTPCCRRAVTDFAVGAAEALYELAGADTVPTHTHAGRGA